MKYLIDTDIVVNHLRGRKKIEEQIVEEGAAISIISYGELLYGANKSQNKERSISLINLFIDDLSIKIINLDEKIMQDYAQTKAQLETLDKRLDEFDLLNGAMAKVNSLTLLTGNIKHFGRIPGLKIVNI